MNENTTVTGVDVDATDPDNGPVTPLVYSIVPGGDGALFTIDSGTGVLTFNSAPNFENPTDSDTNNTYVVTVRASDGAAFDDQTITITVNDVAEAPVIGSNGGGPTASITVNENQTAVTDVDATDPDLPAQTLTYSLVGGTDQAKFNIDSGTGVLTFISAPNFESPTDSDTNNSYVVTVRASDGTLFDDQTITVTVANVNEQPTLAATGATIPYTEDTPSEDHAVTLFTGVAVSAVEPGQNLDQLILTVSNVVDTSERLSIDGSIVALVTGNCRPRPPTACRSSVAFTGTTATVTVAKSGGISAAAMQTLIAGLAYSNTDESPTFGARVVTLVSLRDVGSNTPPNDNIFENIGIFSTVNVAPVNDAPVVTAPGAVNTFIEGAGLATGTPVFVDTAFTVADTDNANLASATRQHHGRAADRRRAELHAAIRHHRHQCRPGDPGAERLGHQGAVGDRAALDHVRDQQPGPDHVAHDLDPGQRRHQQQQHRDQERHDHAGERRADPDRDRERRRRGHLHRDIASRRRGQRPGRPVLVSHRLDGRGRSGDHATGSYRHQRGGRDRISHDRRHGGRSCERQFRTRHRRDCQRVDRRRHRDGDDHPDDHVHHRPGSDAGRQPRV